MADGLSRAVFRAGGRVGPLAAFLLWASVAPPGRAQAPPNPWSLPFDAHRDQKGFSLGAVSVYPYLRINQLGLDTNVFYTPSDRQTDFFASGGPGLTLTLPVGGPFRVVGDGYLDYVFFARTEAQRRLGGQGLGRLEYAGGSARGGVERVFRRTWSRSLEVDERLLVDEWRTSAFVTLGAEGARLRLRPRFDGISYSYPDDPRYLGNRVGRNLSRDTMRLWLGAALRLSAKTSLLLEADYQTERFGEAPLRDLDSNRVGGGFAIASRTRLSGRAVGGIRLFNPKTPFFTGEDRRPYAEIDVDWAFGPRTSLGLGYHSDAQLSGFEANSVYYSQDVPVHLDRALTAKVDVRLFGRYRTLETPGKVAAVGPDGPPVVAVRQDKYWEGGADLGYTIKGRLRIGGTVSYSQRNSNFSDFGIDGVLFGATIRYNPPAF